MAISRSLMNRQLQANGGIMQVAPREKFGLGSKLKKFVRKIIPNEVAEIATKAAPFVAPFNPLLAAGMSGIGTFDQTGSIGDSLKAGGMNYALGQGARYIGGGAQNLQTGFNPFSGYDASAGLTRGLLTNPVSDQGGLGEFFSNRGTKSVQGVGEGLTGSDVGGNITMAESAGGTIASPNILAEQMSEVSLSPQKIAEKVTQETITGSPKQMSITESIKQIVSPNSTMGNRGTAALDLLKRTGKAAFTKEGKNGPVLDKAAVLGAVAFAGSYAEARALAAETGVDMDLTETEYNELAKAEKKEEYANYLTNFFGGKKDGGRIGYESGANEYITRRERQKPMSGLGMLSQEIDPTIDESDQKIIVVMTENGPQIMTESEFNKHMGIDNEIEPIVIDTMNFKKDMKKDGGRIGYRDGTIILSEDELAEMGGEQGLKLKLLAEKFMDDGMSESDAYAKAADSLYANGGRVNRRLGSPKEGESEIGIMSIDVEAGDDEDEEDMMMAYTPGFSSQEKSYLFRRIGAAGGSDRSYTMPQLYRILKNPADYPEDAAVLKEIAVMGLGKKDGGRIGFAFGSPDRKTGIEEELSVDTIYRPTDKPLMLEEMPGGDKMVDMDYTPSFIKDFDKNLDKLSFSKFNKPYIELEILEKEFIMEVMKNIGDTVFKADGGRIGLKGGSGSSNRVAQLILERDYLLSKDEDVSYIDVELESLGYKMRSEGGVMDVKMPTGQMRKNNAGVVERDYRDEGGFVPVGIKERADDVPAMLSKNEFVMTADAVRGIGNGSVEEGSKKLYKTMKQAEKVGKA